MLSVLLLLALPALVAPSTARAEVPVRPLPGVLWNHAGLPAVFPLVVKTSPGRDLYLTLTDREGKAVMGAYLRAGKMFRILVPKGDLTLSFASGPGSWLGREKLFGPGTTWRRLPAPLFFGVTGFGRKSGQIVDLRGAATMTEAAAGARAQVICQDYRLEPNSLLHSPPARPGAPVPRALPPVAGDPDDPGAPGPVPRYHTNTRVCG
ncbi:hypothetical protein [Acidimangrovimonas sediminis]|uniref:hypothetical protein n=1 Tax=Acidimangrovimonas sediminis TaxID=2056283 RepID=UPI000C80384E|nr:hypothetical protein [Acidimangrovimonas sediminis]